MSDSHSVRIALRIPGSWSHPGELIARLPEGCRLEPDSLQLADGSTFEMIPMPPDGEFPGIFESACRQPATPEELAVVRRYSVNICLAGPGGSLTAAADMLRAGAAIIQAGGAGVFIDNSALAHGGGLWCELAEDAGSDAVSFAFVSLVGGPEEVVTMGFHALGLPDVVMRTEEVGADGGTMIEVIRYLAAGEKPFGEGHVMFVEEGGSFRAVQADDDEFRADSPVHNPFGRLKLLSLRELAEEN